MRLLPLWKVSAALAWGRAAPSAVIVDVVTAWVSSSVVRTGTAPMTAAAMSATFGTGGGCGMTA